MWFCGDCVDARGVAGPSPHTSSFPLVVSGNPSFLYAVIPAVSGRYLLREFNKDSYQRLAGMTVIVLFLSYPQVLSRNPSILSLGVSCPLGLIPSRVDYE